MGHTVFLASYRGAHIEDGAPFLDNNFLNPGKPTFRAFRAKIKTTDIFETKFLGEGHPFLHVS